MFDLLMPGEKQYGRGENPKSWAHAKHNKGRPKFEETWGEKSVTRTFAITLAATEELDRIVKSLGFDNRSDYLQHVGVNRIPVLPKELDYEQLSEILGEVGIEDLSNLLELIITGEIELVRKNDEI